MSANNKPEFWIVTGAESGIGAAVVRAVKKLGENVLAVDVDQAKGIALAQETGALCRHCDVGDLTQWQQLVEYLESEKADLGAPTRLHLNAGIQIAPPDSPLSEYQLEAATLERYRRMMGVNVDWVVLACKRFYHFWHPARLSLRRRHSLA